MMRRKGGGFRLGRKLVRIWKWVIKPSRRSTCAGYKRLSNHPDSVHYKTKMMTKLCDWVKRGANSMICSSSSSSSSSSASHPKPPAVQVPKGHLAVYVGSKDDDPHRFLVPVFYFNHPLFGDLLREAETEFGYHHPGRITIPCPVSHFQNVQTEIAATGTKKTTLLSRR